MILTSLARALFSAETNPNRKVPMIKCFSYITTVLLVTTAFSMAAPDKAAIEAKENAAWQAFKDKKGDDFKKVVDNDFVGVYAESISGMKKEMGDMKKWNMQSFKISNFKMFSDEKDIAVSSYIVTVKGTFDGKDASGTFNAGSVWRMKNGHWTAIFHASVKQEK
jgi:hypothetical protein